MEYYLKGKNKEFGPYTKIKMLKMVEDDLISMDSKVRSQMLKEWKKASSFSFLKEAIKKRMAKNGEEYQEENTAYENKLIPVPAGGFLRVMAFVTEIVLLIVISTFSLWVTLGYAKAKGNASTPTLESYMTKSEITEASKITPIPETMIKNREIISSERAPTKSDDEMAKIVRGTVWKYKKSKYDVKTYIAVDVSQKAACWAPVDSVNGLLTFFTCIGLIIYFCLTLFLFGVRSQTVGMWLWGIFLVKYDEEETLEPITADLAFKYYFINLAVGLSTLIVSLSNPQRRSVQEQITDTWMIRVRSKVVD